MNRRSLCWFATSIALLSLSGCGGNASSTTRCPAGDERCDCFGSQTCNASLECRSNLCVAIAGGTSVGGNPSSTGATIAIGGASAAGGATNINGSSTKGGTSAVGGTASVGGGSSTGGSASVGGNTSIGGTANGGGTFGATGGSGATGTGTTCAVASGGRCYVVADVVPYCGDGKIDATIGETCDDSNRVGGDGCSGICKVEPNWTCPNAGKPCVPLIVCGNGLRESGEGCDDGNTNANDGCDARCNLESGWYCAASTPSDPSSKSICRKLASCGDGHITSGETCDLGSANGPGTGCDACRTEDGWVCRPLPTGCTHRSVCGNSKLESGEQCDDGNKESGDGCFLSRRSRNQTGRLAFSSQRSAVSQNSEILRADG